MQTGCIDACHGHTLSRPFLGFRHRANPSPISTSLAFIPNSRVPPTSPRVSSSFNRGKRRKGKERKNGGEGESVKMKNKENVWSIDNELAARVTGEEQIGRRRRGRRVKGTGKKGDPHSRVLVSAAMLMEVETVLQTQEPVIKPAWNTFTSSVSGIWKGVGAVFSPLTAEMEPIGIGNQHENLYDCYTLSRIEEKPSVVQCSQIHRKTNWVTMNPFGESREHFHWGERNKDRPLLPKKKGSDVIDESLDFPSFESFDFEKSEVLEEDFMGLEPGLVFFEDGSYSRGPVDIAVGESGESKYALSTYKFEQCLVKGCHKRLRIVHTIEFNEGGSDIQIIRVALYEEQWVSPVKLYDPSDLQFDLKPFSRRNRTQPSELTGSWKVFEVSATPIFSEETSQENVLPYVYLCTETLKKRSLPDENNPVFFGEEEMMLDTQDVTVLWLPGGVAGYVDVSKDGILCIGVGWYSDEGINLVMERDYGTDGKLKEVRSKSEVKRRWSEQQPFTA